MAALRIALAGLVLALACEAQPNAAQKEWALATAGVLNELDGRRHDVLGDRTAAGIAGDKRILVDYWGVYSREDLLARIGTLYKGRKTKLTAGWDYPRAIMLAR